MLLKKERDLKSIEVEFCANDVEEADSVVELNEVDNEQKTQVEEVSEAVHNTKNADNEKLDDVTESKIIDEREDAVMEKELKVVLEDVGEKTASAVVCSVLVNTNKEIELNKYYKSEFFKEFKDVIYDSFKINDTGIKWKLERTLFGTSCANEGGQKERSTIEEIASKIFILEKRKKRKKKIWIISSFLSKHVRYKRICLE